MVVYTRDIIGNKNLLVMPYYLLFSIVFLLGHGVASLNPTLPGSICDVAVRYLLS